MRGAAIRTALAHRAQRVRSLFGRVRRVIPRLRPAVVFLLKGDLTAMIERQERLEQQMKTVLALGWYHVALARRLAAIEDQLAEFSSAGAAADRGEPPGGQSTPSIRYPNPEDQRTSSPQAKVG